MSCFTVCQAEICAGKGNGFRAPWLQLEILWPSPSFREHSSDAHTSGRGRADLSCAGCRGSLDTGLTGGNRGLKWAFQVRCLRSFAKLLLFPLVLVSKGSWFNNATIGADGTRGLSDGSSPSGLRKCFLLIQRFLSLSLSVLLPWSEKQIFAPNEMSSVTGDRLDSVNSNASLCILAVVWLWKMLKRMDWHFGFVSGT